MSLQLPELEMLKLRINIVFFNSRGLTRADDIHDRILCLTVLFEWASLWQILYGNTQDLQIGP